LRFKASLGQIVHETLSQKNPSQKRAGGVAQGVDPQFKPQYHKKREREKERERERQQGDKMYPLRALPH
jgi:hypothetical protein